jgi:short-subunit dehydrogenase
MSAEEVAVATFKAYQQQKRTLILTMQGKMTVWLNKFFPAFMDKMVFNYFKKEKQN